ncbi:MAG: hypothetical protein BAJALOKI2v1_80051 [Promethearchaeota archaeon]|nr:MAG: hypothetical protein BAJALOKI2v1_80051 [Candidatus Lokiarchaeota archaeon]
MSENGKNIDSILKDYLNQVGTNLVGAVLLDNKGLTLNKEIRSYEIDLDQLEKILSLVKPVIKDFITNSDPMDEEFKSLEVANHLLLLTRVKRFVFLLSIFALDSFIEKFLKNTLETSLEIAAELESDSITNLKVEPKDIKGKINEKSQSEFVLRHYNCNYCKKTHQIKLPKNLLENKDQFPFPYVYLHSSIGELRDLLTTLYIDRDLQIRGAEVIKVEDGDIFSEKLTRKITAKLMEQIARLEEENLELRSLIEKIDLKKAKFECEEEDAMERKVSAKMNLKLYFLSIIGKYETRREFTAMDETTIRDLKIRASNLFNLDSDEFHLSYGGIIMDPTLPLKHYNLVSGEEILVIPAQI